MNWMVFVNSAEAVAGLEFYKELYDCCTPPGSSDWYMSENIDAYKSGQVALQMNFAFIWPGVHADPNVGGDKSGYFPNPAGPGGHFAQLGGQGISVVAYSDSQDAALEYIKWFAQPEIQKKWWELGGYSALRAVVEDPGFATSQPYAADLPGLDGDREGLLGGTSLRITPARDARSRPQICDRRRQARRKRPSMAWSRTGPRSSKMKASSKARLSIT